VAHLIEFIGYVQKEDEDGNFVGERFILARGMVRREITERCEAFEQIADYKVVTYIEGRVLRVDVKQIVINLMGSSMGDLELMDIKAARVKGGPRARHHVLRRKAFDGCQASRALAILEHTANGEYQWVLTKEGFEYLLENGLLGPECIVDWAREAQKSAPDLYEG
jgi:hypothetical protein